MIVVWALLTLLAAGLLVLGMALAATGARNDVSGMSELEAQDQVRPWPGTRAEPWEPRQ